MYSDEVYDLLLSAVRCFKKQKGKLVHWQCKQS